MKKQFKGSIALLGATIIWGSAFIAQSVGMELIGPFTFQSIRCCLAVVFLFLMTLLLDGSNAIQKWKNKKLWISGAICGGALFIAASLQQVGLVSTDPGKAGFLTAMYIVLVPILGIFVHRKPGINALFSVILAVAGLYLLSFMGVSEETAEDTVRIFGIPINIGDVFLIGCALAFAVQILLIDKFAPDLDGLRLNCVQALVVAVLSVPFMFFTEEIDWVNIRACWLPLSFAGILSMGVAYSLQIVGQKNMEPTAASLIMSLESVFAALGGWLILHETMSSWEMCGSALVFAGVVVSQLPIPAKSRRAPK